LRANPPLLKRAWAVPRLAGQRPHSMARAAAARRPLRPAGWG